MDVKYELILSVPAGRGWGCTVTFRLKRPCLHLLSYETPVLQRVISILWILQLWIQTCFLPHDLDFLIPSPTVPEVDLIWCVWKSWRNGLSEKAVARSNFRNGRSLSTVLRSEEKSFWSGFAVFWWNSELTRNWAAPWGCAASLALMDPFAICETKGTSC